MKIQYANEFIQKIKLGDTTTCVHKFILMKMIFITQILYNILL